MNKNIYLAGAAVAAAAVTAGLVIIIARPPAPVAAAPQPSPTHVLSTATHTPTTSSSSATTTVTTSARPVPAVSRSTVPPLAAADQMNAMIVAQTAVQTMYSIDTALDDDPTDGLCRAAYLLTPSYAAVLTTPATTGSGVRWQQWTDEKAYVTVTTKKINIPWTIADNRLTVVRNVGFIQTVHSPAGPAALQQQTLAVTLVRDADGKPWRINSMETP